MQIERPSKYTIHVLTADKTFVIFQPDGEEYTDAQISKAVRRKMGKRHDATPV